jgi:hypothetical protein
MDPMREFIILIIVISSFAGILSVVSWYYPFPSLPESIFTSLISVNAIFSGFLLASFIYYVGRINALKKDYIVALSTLLDKEDDWLRMAAQDKELSKRITKDKKQLITTRKNEIKRFNDLKKDMDKRIKVMLGLTAITLVFPFIGLFGLHMSGAEYQNSLVYLLFSKSVWSCLSYSLVFLFFTIYLFIKSKNNISQTLDEIDDEYLQDLATVKDYQVK